MGKGEASREVEGMERQGRGVEGRNEEVKEGMTVGGT